MMWISSTVVILADARVAMVAMVAAVRLIERIFAGNVSD